MLRLLLSKLTSYSYLKDVYKLMAVFLENRLYDKIYVTKLVASS